MTNRLGGLQIGLFTAFSLFALSDAFDVSTTIYALKLGFYEANITLTRIASSLGFGFVNSFLFLKVSVTLGSGLLLFLSIRSGNRKIAKMSISIIASLAIVFGIAALNNFFVILTAA